MHSSASGFRGGGGPRGWDCTDGSLYLVDAELALEAAARPAVQRDLHGVVDVPHFMPAHLILDVQPDHCEAKKGRVTNSRRNGVKGQPPPPSTPRTGGAGLKVWAQSHSREVSHRRRRK